MPDTAIGGSLGVTSCDDRVVASSRGLVRYHMMTADGSPARSVML